MQDHQHYFCFHCIYLYLNSVLVDFAQCLYQIIDQKVVNMEEVMVVGDTCRSNFGAVEYLRFRIRWLVSIIPGSAFLVITALPPRNKPCRPMSMLSVLKIFLSAQVAVSWPSFRSYRHLRSLR